MSDCLTAKPVIRTVTGESAAAHSHRAVFCFTAPGHGDEGIARRARVLPLFDKGQSLRSLDEVAVASPGVVPVAGLYARCVEDLDKRNIMSFQDLPFFLCKCSMKSQ